MFVLATAGPLSLCRVEVYSLASNAALGKPASSSGSGGGSSGSGGGGGGGAAVLTDGLTEGEGACLRVEAAGDGVAWAAVDLG